MSTTYAMLARNAVANALGPAAGADWVALANGDPGSTGANEVTTIARKQSTFPTAADGESLGSLLEFAVPLNSDFTHYIRWTASTAGTPHSSGPLPGSGEHYSVAGSYFLRIKAVQGAVAA